MNRPDFGKYSGDAEEKILLASVFDKYRACRDKNTVVCTQFLSEHESAVARCMLDREHIAYFAYGGYDNAERKAIYFLPDYCGEDRIREESPYISYLRITPDPSALSFSRKKELSHRDYMGSVLGLGIKRGQIGDISVSEDGADIIVNEDISEFIISEYRSTGSVKSECVSISKDEFRAPRVEFEIIKDTVPSPRLDCIVASAAGVSRGGAEKLIRAGNVEVSHMPVYSPDTRIDEGALLSIKGYGRYEVSSLGGLSKKGRIFAEIKRYK